MIGTLLALVVAVLGLEPMNGAYVVAFGSTEAVYVTSVAYEQPGATNPYVRAKTPSVDRALDPRRVQRQVCVRSDHDLAGELYVSSDRFRPVMIPHGAGLATRCALVRTYGWSQRRPGRVFVEEGTYWGTNGQTAEPVDGWVVHVSVRSTP